ncbi:hypothetical protein N1495_09015 [Streptococcus didelphis]|uniref:Uncharacterized protein n=1 Tax=Streptococcus didelphis TaxID=102886 RepID=A0ABY9LIQ8_9STRE|nr:hypothetical protein [Streptococcus didelphis]WMB28760.1 hypothetical protein N1496_04765 [Streptococcus didelphis]WMB29424.1 hypothetical protein N1495_09015 [Streptococcus didelphis]
MGSIPLKIIDLLLDDIIEDYYNPIEKKILNTYYLYLIDRDLTIPYDKIAEYVYQNEKSNENNEILNLKINAIISRFQGNSEDKKVLEKNLDKIKNNYTLSQIQKEFIIDNTKKAHNSLEKFKRTALNLERQTKEIEANTYKVAKEIDSFKTTKSEIYTDFIAILGVFSTFVFVMFAGINIARAIFDIGNDLQTMDLSRMITIASLMMIGMLILMYSLLLWLASITGKDFGRCPSEGCVSNACSNVKHIFSRHSFFFGILILLTVISMISHLFF